MNRSPGLSPRAATRLRVLAVALVLSGTGALLFAAVAALAFPFFGGEHRRPLVHGERPFEKGYSKRMPRDAWRPVVTGIDDDLTGVWALDATHAWVSGASGGLYRTRDGGATWEPLVGVDAVTFAQLVWPDPERGFALTRDGRLSRTDNGGATWKTLKLVGRSTPRRIAFASAQEGWIAGDRGLLRHTRDGGETWEDENPEGGGDLTDLQMLSPRTLYAGGKGALLRTEDGGAHWTDGRAFELWTFVSGRRGYASDGQGILKTEDGGKTWKRLGLLAGATAPGSAEEEPGPEGSERADSSGGRIVRIQFVDRYNGIVERLSDDRQVILRTQSLGRRWKPVYEARRGSPQELVAIAMQSGAHGFAIDAEGNLRATTDGGRTWKVQVGATSFDLADVHFLDARSGWAVGGAGEVLVTVDGGATWHEAPRRAAAPLARVRAVRDAGGQTRVWAVGAHGTIVASPLGGRPWQSIWRSQGGRTRRDLHALAMFDPLRGIAAGDGGTIISTQDGGATWVPRTVGTGASLRGAAVAGPGRVLLGGQAALLGSGDGGETFREEPGVARELVDGIVDVAAPDPDHLFALTREGTLLRSRDGGTRWQAAPIASAARFTRLVFVDPEHGWALAERAAGGPAVHVTADGGDTWRERPIPADEIRGIAFPDALSGWAVGPQTILVSRDGGENWRRQSIGAARGVRAFAFQKDGGGWAAGDNGLVLRYTPAPPRRSGKDETQEKQE